MMPYSLFNAFNAFNPIHCDVAPSLFDPHLAVDNVQRVVHSVLPAGHSTTQQQGTAAGDTTQSGTCASIMVTGSHHTTLQPHIPPLAYGRTNDTADKVIGGLKWLKASTTTRFLRKRATTLKRSQTPCFTGI
jgi:hypothetical protein